MTWSQYSWYGILDLLSSRGQAYCCVNEYEDDTVDLMPQRYASTV